MKGGPFLHACEAPGCTAWGAYGYGVRLLRGQRGQWFCKAHRPKAEAPPPPVAKPARWKPETKAKPLQRSLF